MPRHTTRGPTLCRAALLGMVLALAIHPCSGATPVVMHPVPEDFENPAALKYADAVGHGDVAAALAAAKQAPNGIDTVGKEGGTGLWIAVNRGDKTMVRALRQAGAHDDRLLGATVARAADGAEHPGVGGANGAGGDAGSVRRPPGG